MSPATLLSLLLLSVQSAAEEPAGVSQQASKRIGAVVDTLNDLLQSIENEEKDEAANFKCLMQWCDDTWEDLSGEQERLESGLEDNAVEVKHLDASIATLDHNLKEGNEELEATKDGIEQANSIRNNAAAHYDQEFTMNQQSMNQIVKAINLLDNVHQAGGFLQGGVLQKLQINEPGESSYILGVFKQLKNNIQRNIDEAKKAEDTKIDLHGNLIKTKTEQQYSLEEMTQSKRIQTSEEKVSLAQTQSDIKRQSSLLQESKANLKAMQHHCDTKRKEWKQRGEDRAKEKAAIREAVSYLMITMQEQGSDAPSFLQVGASDNSLGMASALVSAANAQLAAMSTQTDQGTKKELFAQVKTIIVDLIKVIQQEQVDEKEKKGYCVQEKQNKELEQVDTTDEIAGLTATIEAKTTEVSTLTTEVAEIEKKLEDSKKRLESAGNIRKEEKDIYEAGAKDRALAVKVLRQAKMVLKAFYDSQEASLAQTSAASRKNVVAPPPKTWESGSGTRKSGEGNIVLNMLDKIAHDIEHEEKDAALAESEAAKEHLELKAETRREYDEGQREIRLRVARKAKLLVQLDSHKETKTAKEESLEAINAQLVSLGKECDDLVKTFDARTKARDFEIEQLRDVIGILSGASIAARTGDQQALLQAGNIGQASDSEMAAFRSMSQAVEALDQRARALAQHA